MLTCSSNVRPPVPPTVLGSGDVRTLTAPVDGHLTMECLVDTDPPPTIDWFRDQVKLEVRRSGEKKKFKKKNRTIPGTQVFVFVFSVGGTCPEAGWRSVPGDPGGQS